MDAPDSWQEIMLRPLAAIVGAALLGLDREIHGKPAGLRTHMMVALGATVFTLVTLQLFEQMRQDGNAWAGADPLRAISGVAGGIGFLGAGAIIQSRGMVEGITTAATIWVTGALGVACGAGYYRMAGALVGYALVILVVIGWMESRFRSRRPPEPPASAADETTVGPRFPAGGVNTG
jgi:putative Mg2+ transporter-C (MgtC) family protein